MAEVIIPAAGDTLGRATGNPGSFEYERNQRLTRYAQALGISYDEADRLSRAGLSDSDFEDMVRSKDYPDDWKRGQSSWNKYTALQNATRAAAQAKGVNPSAQPKVPTPRERMQELYDRLSKPANAATDPVLAGLQQLGQGQGARMSRGFRSDVGAGAQLGAAAARNMSLPYLSARENIANSLLGQMDQSDLNWAQVDQAQARIDNELAANKFQMDANSDAAIGSGVGGVLGAGLGALASIPSFGTLAPLLIPAGASAGAGVGGGIGMASSRRPTFSNYGSSRRSSRYPGSGF